MAEEIITEQTEEDLKEALKWLMELDLTKNKTIEEKVNTEIFVEEKKEVETKIQEVKKVKKESVVLNQQLELF